MKNSEEIQAYRVITNTGVALFLDKARAEAYAASHRGLLKALIDLPTTENDDGNEESRVQPNC